MGDGDAFDEAEVQPLRLEFPDEGGCSTLKVTTMVSYIEICSSHPSHVIDFLRYSLITDSSSKETCPSYNDFRCPYSGHIMHFF